MNILTTISTLGLALSISAAANGAPITGSLEANQLQTTDRWNNITPTVEWQITDNQDGQTWNYAYTFIGFDGRAIPTISHFILQLSEGAPAEDFTSFTSSGAGFDGNNFTDFRLFNQGQPSDPNLQSNVYGVKIDLQNTGDNFTIAFDANRLPMWGDIHIKGGQSEAWNQDFAVEVANLHDYFADHALDATGNELAKILVPNSIVPEPGTLALLGIGGFTLLIRRRAAASPAQ
ncbi:PEP-CTERM sorting domain-containing protein [Phycisphaerales bacterium AB-hyl4]|uniref:PEP-CTERM sorting domain-containing protein n=1 Tax=Natronomicrosphaera hydrolytica TaxID=3242702 RepID=A0ABV4U211_9BACT